MNQKPIVTVVVPAWNRERYIGEAIRSIVAQQDVVCDIILVDGGSQDATVEAARRILPSIRVISAHVKGVAQARNIGRIEAKTLWLAYLDADDIWNADKIKSQLQLALSEPDVAMVFCDAWQFSESVVLAPSSLARYDLYRSLAKRGVAADSFVFDERFSQQIMRQNFIVTTSTVMIRRDVFIEVGGFDEDLPVCEDYDLWMRVAKSHKVGVVERALAGYRQHGNGLSDDNRRMLRGRIAVAERALARPERYPESASSFFLGEKSHRQKLLGRLELLDGKAREARSHLWRSLTQQPRLDTAQWWLSTFFPAKWRDGLRRLKR